MIAGSVSAIGNNPVDMVKTRMQGIESKKYHSTLDCFKTVLSQEGPMAFYKGIGARLIRVIPGQAIVFASYEKISTFLEKMFYG